MPGRALMVPEKWNESEELKNGQRSILSAQINSWPPSHHERHSHATGEEAIGIRARPLRKRQIRQSVPEGLADEKAEVESFLPSCNWRVDQGRLLGCRVGRENFGD